MKLYFSVDMEGVGGIVDIAQTDESHREYPRAQGWLMEEINAAIESALDSGASEVLVNDAHSTKRNILLDRLHPRAELISGSQRPMGQVAGLDGSFDAVVLLAYHARAGNFGILAHTRAWTNVVTELRVNGAPFGETGLSAMVAGHFGVPVVLISGDDVVNVEARELLPEVEGVVVKYALSRYAARCLPREEVLRRIGAGMQRALRRSPLPAPFVVATPIRLEVDFASQSIADYAMDLPGAERVAGITVAYTAPDALTAYQAYVALFGLGGRELRG
jgi:D-amino peptidase